MKSIRFVLAAACLAISGARCDADISTDNLGPASAPAPSSTEASTTSTTNDSAKIADFERRFAEGKQLEAEGKLTDALVVFNGILAEAPDAKGSLREAGLISVELNDFQKADAYFSKLHALVPDYPMAIEALIQVNQTLKHDAKVEILIKQFKDLFAAGKVPEPYFVRERIHLDGGTEIAITQFFDYHQPRYYAWAGELFGPNHTLKRRLTVNYDPDVTQNLRAKDPELAHAEQLLLVDNVLTDGHVTRLDVYQQFLSLPDYLKMRTIMMEVFANALKPIDSAPIPQSPQ
jgi:tetratricopeptide (TPR) repeat protein